MTNELIQKAKECKTAEELLALAKENGVEMTAEQAAQKFAALQNEGELADDELENASGGGCYTDDGSLKTTMGYSCDNFERDGAEPIGIDGTCYCCKWWDADHTNFAFLGEPGICRNPANKK